MARESDPIEMVALMLRFLAILPWPVLAIQAARLDNFVERSSMFFSFILLFIANIWMIHDIYMHAPPNYLLTAFFSLVQLLVAFPLYRLLSRVRNDQSVRLWDGTDRRKR